MGKLLWDIDQLHEWEKNPRTISKENFERLKNQIKELGEYKPLIITKDGTVLGGNMRLKAYRELGYKKVWVSIVEADTEEEKIKYALSDNDQLGEYQKDDLANLVGSFPNLDLSNFTIQLEKPKPLGELIDEFKEVVEDEVPEVEEGEPKSKLGEIYQLGRHRLMCGDATKREDVERLMNGEKADMVFTDPPYGIDLDTDFSGMVNNLKFAREKNVKSGKKYNKVIGDDVDFNPAPYLNLAPEVFMWGGDYYYDKLPKGGSWIVWDKRLDESADKMYGSCFELCWSKKKHRREIVRIKWAGIFGTEKEFDHKRYHPTQKPIDLCKWFIEKFSKRGQIIIDLFGGSGSTLMACEQTNRICYMMEIDPHYCDVIRKRYANFIGKKDLWETITPKI